jgi:hypothetical protein
MAYVRRGRGDVGRERGLGYRCKYTRNQSLLMSRIFIFFSLFTYTLQGKRVIAKVIHFMLQNNLRQYIILVAV